MGVNPELLKLATWRANQLEKEAIVPAGGGMDPMAGGAPPMPGGAPPMPGGAPPMDPMAGGMPPMDPMAGGMPPMDPMAGGGGPPMPPEGGSPDQIRTIIQEELAAAGMGGKGGDGATGQKKKFEPEEINQKLHTMEKLLAAMANALGVSLPPETLVSDNPETGEEVVPEGNQPAPTEDNLQLGGGPPSGGAYAGVKDQPMDSAIKPVDPIQPAMPEVPKMAEAVPSVGTPIADQYVSPRELLTKTSALAHMARRISSGSENATP